MAHTQTKELNKIVLGSMDFYVMAFTGSIPTDEEIEKEENMIGRTKNGATINYNTTWYLAESDDGKAKKRKITGENMSIGYGNITWNGNTIKALVATARTTEANGKRTTKIGGIENDDGIRYLIRGVHKDKVDGDIRITGVGVNTASWEAAFSPTQETIITPTFELEPKLDDDGTLLIYEEEIIEPAVGITLSKRTETVVANSTITLTASTSPVGETVTWASSDEDNATVTSGGVVTGVSAGTATITASITVDGNTYTDSCVVTVTSAGA